MILLADEDFDFPIVLKLRELGIDIITVADLLLDNQGTPDTDIYKVATDHGRAVVTFNRKDFLRIHNQSTRHSGIIVCKRNTPVALLVQKISDLVQSTVDFSGQLHRIVQP